MGKPGRSLVCSPEVAALVPASLAFEFGVFPLRSTGGVLSVAVASPLSDEDRGRVEFITNRQIREVLYPDEVIRRSLDVLHEKPIEIESGLTFYWPECRAVEEDGTIVIKASGYERNGTHWTGSAEIEPDHPDFALWTWIIAQGDRFDSIISDAELDAIREEFGRHR